MIFWRRCLSSNYHQFTHRIAPVEKCHGQAWSTSLHLDFTSRKTNQWQPQRNKKNDDSELDFHMFHYGSCLMVHFLSFPWKSPGSGNPKNSWTLSSVLHPHFQTLFHLKPSCKTHNLLSFSVSHSSSFPHILFSSITIWGCPKMLLPQVTMVGSILNGLILDESRRFPKSWGPWGYPQIIDIIGLTIINIH